MSRKLALAFIALSFVSLRAFAQAPQVLEPQEDPVPAATADREPAQVPLTPHAYAGARDEQKLELQTSLPQPSRSLEGTVNPAGEDDDDAPPATAPASD